MIVDGEHFPVEALRNGGAFGIDGHDLKPGFAAFLDTRFKGGLYADIKGFGPVGHADAFGDCAATGLEHADNCVEPQRQAGIRTRRAGREADDRLAGTVRSRIIELEYLFLECLIVAAIGETVERLEGRRVGFEPGFGFHRQARAGGAIQEARVDLDIPHAARFEGTLLVGLHIDGNALGHEILDGKAHFAGGSCKTVDFDAGAPFAARGAARQREGRQHGAGFRIREPDFRGDQAVRPVDHEVAIAAGDLTAGTVAQHGGQLDAFAGAVDTAVSIDKGIHGAGRAPSADFLFGEINRRAGKVQRSKFAVRSGRQHQAGRHVALAVHQRSIKRDAALFIRFGFREDGIVGSKQLDGRVADGLAILQRAQRDIEAVLAAIGGEREIGEENPAAGRGGRAFGVVQVGGVADPDEIGAGLHRPDDILKREDGDHRRVGRAGDVHDAGEEFFADIIRRIRTPEPGPLALPGRGACVDVLEDERAVIDAADGDADLVDIDGLDRQPVSILARQDHAGTLEADERRTVSKVDRNGFGSFQRAAVSGGKTGEDRRSAGGTEGEAANA